MPSEPSGGAPEGPDPLANEHVWSFRGYSLRPSEFTSALTAYYHAEIDRSNTWRQRLDATTNWAVITTGASLAFAFASDTNHHGLIILATCLVTFFAWIEARRYRYYELWSYRARLMDHQKVVRATVTCGSKRHDLLSMITSSFAFFS